MTPLLDVLPFPLFLALAGVFGAMVGSFLNVVILRVPAKQSLVRPGSRCPHCEKPIRWFDNIPVLSWLVLRGKCRDCSGKISARYMLVELMTAGLAVAVFAVWKLTPLAGAYFVFGASLIAVTFIDIDHRIIPNVISLPGILLGLAIMPWVFPDRGALPVFINHLLGAVVGGGFLLLTAWLYELIRKREGMGMGDVKLLAMIGAFLGLKSIFFTLLLGAFVGSIFGVVLMIAQRKADGQLALPFGPYLSMGALLFMFFSDALARYFPMPGTV